MTAAVQGVIQVGDRFIWEPNFPSSWTWIEVTKLHDNGKELWIQARCLKGNVGEEFWTSEDRFRETCVRTPR